METGEKQLTTTVLHVDHAAPARHKKRCELTLVFHNLYGKAMGNRLTIIFTVRHRGCKVDTG